MQRLIVFCSDLDLDRVTGAVRSVRGEHPELGPLELEELEPPAALTEAGWTAMAMRPLRGRGGSPAELDAQVEPLVTACAKGLSDRIVGIFHDPANGYARACFQDGAKAIRRAEGDAGRVLKQVATWMACDAREFAEYFRTPPLSPELELPAAPEAVEVDFSEAEPDEDDRFVESKLKQARALMEQYRASRK